MTEPKLFTYHGFTLIGKTIAVSTDTENPIPAFWDQCRREGVLQKLVAENPSKIGLVGACHSMCDQQFAYMIAIEKSPTFPIDDFDTFDVPAGEWAAFEVVGALPASIQNASKEIMAWLEQSPYRHTGLIDLEVYTPGDTQSDTYVCYIWLPITPK